MIDAILTILVLVLIWRVATSATEGMTDGGAFSYGNEPTMVKYIDVGPNSVTMVPRINLKQ